MYLWKKEFVLSLSELGFRNICVFIGMNIFAKKNPNNSWNANRSALPLSTVASAGAVGVSECEVDGLTVGQFVHLTSRSAKSSLQWTRATTRQRRQCFLILSVGTYLVAERSRALRVRQCVSRACAEPSVRRVCIEPYLKTKRHE